MNIHMKFPRPRLNPKQLKQLMLQQRSAFRQKTQKIQEETILLTEQLKRKLDQIDVIYTTQLKEAKQRSTRSTHDKQHIVHLHNIKGHIDTMKAHIRSKRSPLLSAPFLIGFGAICDYLLNFNDASQTDIDQLYDIVATEQAQISELQTASKDIIHAIEMIQSYLPVLTDSINRFQMDTALIIQDMQIDHFFEQAKSALADNLIEYTFAIQLADQGQLTTYLLNDVEASRVKAFAKATYHHDIDISRNRVITKVLKQKAQISIIYAFPIIDPQRQAALYKVTPFPIFSNGTRFTAIPTSKYIATLNNNNGYVKLSEEEAIVCITDINRCEVTEPIHTDTDNVCGVSNLIGKDPNCPMTVSKDLSDFFYTVGNQTIYSVSGSGIKTSHCNHHRGAGAEANTMLTGNGIFFTTTGCYHSYNKHLIYPSNTLDHELIGTSIFENIIPSLTYNSIYEDTPLGRHIVNILAPPIKTFSNPLAYDSNFTYTQLEPAKLHPLHQHAGILSTASLSFILIFIVAIVVLYYINKCRSRMREARSSPINVHFSPHETAPILKINTTPSAPTPAPH